MNIKEYLCRHDLTQVAFAKKLSITATHLSLITKKKRTPSIHLARRIEAITEREVTVYELLDITMPKGKETII